MKDENFKAKVSRMITQGYELHGRGIKDDNFKVEMARMRTSNPR